MATTDTLCFGDADGVTGNPVINGLVDYDFLPFLAADPNESGYVNGSRLTFEGGSLARVIFQGVHQPLPDRIVMGFLCRFDTSFDESDFIVIALRSHFASASPARLIVIYPNLAGVGAEPGPGDGPYHIKRNVVPLPANLDFYQDMGGAWSQISAPASVEVKARSWTPNRPDGSPDECAWSVEVSMPRTGAADWITLNDDFGLYFNVVRVFQPGDMVVQSAFPTTATDLAEEPGVNFVVPQWGHGLIPAVQTPAGSNLGLGVRFKNGWMGVGRRPLGSMTTSLTSTIEGPAGATDNELVALVENTGAAAANDLTAEFRFANWGLPAPTFPAWDLALGVTPNPTPRRIGLTPPPLDPPVNLAAAPQPTMPTQGELKSPWLRANVPADYQAHSHQCIWVQLASATTVNFTQAAVRRNMDFADLSEVKREAEVSGEGYPDPADGSGEHDFVIETFCRQLNVAELITGKEVPDETGALLENVLGQSGPREEPNVVSMASTGGSRWKNTVVYLWMAQGYRRTGTFVKIRGRVYENLDHTPGQFGVAARHEGLQDKFGFALEGPGLVQYAPGAYGLKVPHKGRTRIGITLSADREGPAGDRSTLPKAPWPKPGSIGGDGTGTPGGDAGDLPKGCLALLFRLLGMRS